MLSAIRRPRLPAAPQVGPAARVTRPTAQHPLGGRPRQELGSGPGASAPQVLPTAPPGKSLTSQAALGGAAGLGPRVSESEGVPPQCSQICSVICSVRSVRDRTTQKQDHFHPGRSETRSGEMSGL